MPPSPGEQTLTFGEVLEREERGERVACPTTSTAFHYCLKASELHIIDSMWRCCLDI